jgi:hypothetical protein
MVALSAAYAAYRHCGCSPMEVFGQVPGFGTAHTNQNAVLVAKMAPCVVDP